MKKINLLTVLMTLICSTSAFSEIVINCQDGNRSMVVSLNESHQLVGELKDFQIALKDMSCSKIPNTMTVRCDKGEYYVEIFKMQSGELTAQVNLTGNFYDDSGYLHSLNCR